MPLNLLRFLLLITVMLLTVPLWAQPPGPVIGDREIQRQEEVERQRRQELEDRAPDIHFQTQEAPEAQLTYPAEEAPCLVINEIVLDGREADKFQWALKAVEDAKGRCLGTLGFNVLMSRVQNRIVEQGYITTRIVAAPQDLTTGKLVLTVIPGKIGGVKLAPGSGRHVILDTALPVRPGDILNIRDVEQGLENLKRVPTAEVDFQLIPGEEEGESLILVSWKQGRPFRFTFSVDDSGSDYTGRYLGNATLSLDNPLGFSDLFYASVGINLEHHVPYGNRSHSFYYSLPLGYWQFTASNSYYTYHQQVAGLWTDYEYSGQSRQTSLEASRVVWRGARGKTALKFAGFANSSRNFINETEVEIQRRRMGGWEAGLNHRHYLGAWTLDADMTWHRGTGAFDALPAPEEETGEGTSRPEIFKIFVRGQYPFQLGGQSLRYIGQWRQQWAFDKLVSRDRFSIGGRYTVRGYSGDMTLSADNGFTFRNELGLIKSALGQDNSGDIQSAGTLKIAAGTLVINRTSGRIIGQDSLIETDQVHNQGLIDGGEVVIKADSITNIFTGTIFGDHLALAARIILNGLPDSIDDGRTESHSGLIGARARLDTAVGESLVNREKGIIYSAGDWVIGRNLDEDHKAVGQGGTVLNSSAVIDIAGSLFADVALFRNFNAHYDTVLEVIQNYSWRGYRFEGDPTIYIEGDPTIHLDGYPSIQLDGEQGGGTGRARGGDHAEEDFWLYEVNRVVRDTKVVDSAPGFVNVGGDMVVTGELSNDKSVLEVLGTLGVTGSFENIKALEPTIITDSGTFRWTYVDWNSLGTSHERKRNSRQTYNPAPVYVYTERNIVLDGYSRPTRL